MNNILITGAGMVGAQIARILIQEYDLRPVLLDLRFDREYLGSIFDLDKAVLVEGDILDQEFKKNVLIPHNISHLIHTAAVLPMRVGHDAHPGFYQVNSWGTSNLMFQCADAQISRFIMFSTNGVYQFKNHPVEAAVQEDFPSGLSENNSYGNSKAVAEALLRELANKGAFQANIVRPGEIFGPVRQSGDHAIYWKEMLDAAIDGRELVFDNEPEHRLDWVYAKDVAEIAVRLILADQTPHIEYHAAMSAVLGIYDWKEALDSHFPGNKVALNNCQKGGWQYPLAMDRVREDLGYTPQFDLEKGIEDYLQWRSLSGLK